MDVTVESVSEACCRELRRAGYMESTIAEYRKNFRRLAALSGDGTVDEGVLDAFAGADGPDGRPYSRGYRSFRRRVARLARDFAEAGSFDLSRFDESPPRGRLPHALAAALEGYARHNEERGLAPRTRRKYEALAEEFLAHLGASDIVDVGEADGAAVLGFLGRMRDRWPGTPTRHITSMLGIFLHWAGRDDLDEALALARSPAGRGIARTLEGREAELVAAACLDGTVGARDAAMALLCLTTGMRSVDVAGLRLSDIDWRSMTVSVVQSKTGRPVSVPMLPALADRLGEYILCERPACGSDRVFLRMRAPHAPLAGSSAVYNSVRRTLERAGVGSGGTGLLRRSAATSMLRSEVRLPVISAVLGHSDPRSADAYLDCDDAGMAACVLPLPEGASL